MADAHQPLLISDLARYRAEADRARERYERQFIACFEAGYLGRQIADAIGLSPQAVSDRRAKYLRDKQMAEAR